MTPDIECQIPQNGFYIFGVFWGGAAAGAGTAGMLGAGRAAVGALGGSGCAAQSGSGAVAMGRATDSRVIPYAIEHGYGFYKGTPKVVPRFLDKVVPDTLKKVDLWFNKRWINDQMRRGNKIVDIGEPSGMPPSDFYDMERRLISGYWNYIQDIQP